jgi:hypothetical protein
MFKRGLSGGPGVRLDRVRCSLVPSRPTAPHASYCGMRDQADPPQPTGQRIDRRRRRLQRWGGKGV